MQQLPYENRRLRECSLLCLCVTPEEWQQIAVRRRALGFLVRWDVPNITLLKSAIHYRDEMKLYE